jgi:hypothetical protein
MCYVRVYLWKHIQDVYVIYEWSSLILMTNETYEIYSCTITTLPLNISCLVYRK